MFWLFLGVLIWTLAHLFPSVMVAKRNELNQSLGSQYQGIFAGIIVLSLILIVVGWRSAAPEAVYNPPSWGRHLNMLFMLVVIILFAISHGKSRLKQYIRHPMLTAVHIWALGHLLANGDNRSVVLFGGMLIWSALNIWFINQRDGAWEKPSEIASTQAELKTLGISVAVYIVLALLHPWFAGVPVA